MFYGEVPRAGDDVSHRKLFHVSECIKVLKFFLFIDDYRHEITHDAPEDGKTQKHKGRPRGYFFFPKPPCSDKREGDEQRRVVPESFGYMALHQGKHHPLCATERAIETRQPVEWARQHVKRGMLKLIFFAKLHFILENTKK